MALRDGFPTRPQRVIIHFRPSSLPFRAAFCRLVDSFAIASYFKFTHDLQEINLNGVFSFVITCEMIIFMILELLVAVLLLGEKHMTNNCFDVFRAFSILLLSALVSQASPVKLYLAPSAECGTFITLIGDFSVMPESECKLSYTDDALRLDAILRKPDGAEFIATGKTDDEMSVFAGDVFEFSVAPAGQDGAYYHFAISPNTHCYTARKKDVGWEPKACKIDSSFKGNVWNLSLEVPFSDFQAKRPKDGDVWRVNLAKTLRVGSKPETSSICGSHDFHDITSFAEVVFGVKPQNQQFRLAEFRPDGKGGGVFLFRTDRACTVTAEFVKDGKTDSERLTFVDGKALFTPKPATERFIPIKPSSPATIRLTDGNNTLFECEAGIGGGTLENVLELERFYCLLTDRHVAASHSMPEQGTVTSLFLNGKKVWSMNDTPRKFEIPFNATGRYRIEIRHKNALTSRVFIVLADPPAVKPILTREPLSVKDGRLLRGGKPVFLFALSPTPKSFLQFDNVLNCKYHDKGAVENATQIGGFPGATKLVYKPFTGRYYKPIEQYVEDCVKYAEARRERSDVLWRLQYEASIPEVLTEKDGRLVPGETLSRYIATYDAVKKAAPSLIYSIHVDNTASIAPFSKACDVFEVAFYSSSYATSMMPSLPRDIEKVKGLACQGKPIIYWLGGTVPDNHSRIAEEIRAAVYMSVMEGLAGNIVHLGHGFLPEERTRLWSLLSGICHEIEEFHEEFATGTPLPVKDSGAFMLRAVRTQKGQTLLLALNTTPAEELLLTNFNGRLIKKVFTPYEPILFRQD